MRESFENIRILYCDSAQSNVRPSTFALNGLENHCSHENVYSQDKEREHTPQPCHANSRLPMGNDEYRRQSERNTVRVERNRGVDWRMQEALDDVVIADGKSKQRSKPDEERCQCKDKDLSH